MSDLPTLITGARGFIGRRLRRPGDRALVRSAAAAGEIVGNLNDGESLLRACDGIEQVFHCAGYAHALADSDSSLHWSINFEGTRNLVDAAAMAGVKKFIFLSSVKAMAEPGGECIDEAFPGVPVTPYGQAKRAAEDYLLKAGEKHDMHVVNLRLAMVYGRGGRGNLERMARAIRSGWFPPLPETGNRRSLVHVDDVVAAMRLAAENPAAKGRTYIVADATPYSGAQIYAALRTALEMPPARWHVPASVFHLAARMGGRMGEVVDRLLGSACYLPARIENELGWKARICLARGLREMLDDTSMRQPA